jgi:predicted alpha/beta hydrolase family esterase
MKKVIIVHGWEGKPESNWFPWLARELETQGVTVVRPQFPPDTTPSLANWLAVLEAQSPDENTVLVGHSLGVITILRHLQSRETPIRGAVLVAGFARDIGISELQDFFRDDVNFNRVREQCPQSTIINSDNDPYVPLAEGEFIAAGLRTPLVIAHGKKHLNEDEGVIEYKPIFDAVLSIFEL